MKTMIQKLKEYENEYVFMRWATAEEYGKIKQVGSDFVEFEIINIETMDYSETVIVSSQLILEIISGGSDIFRIIAEMSSRLPAATRD